MGKALTAPQTKESFVVQAKRPGTRSYADALAAKPTLDKARDALSAAREKANGDGTTYRLVRRVTEFTHTDTPVK
jgi:hypothetical protein